MHTNTSMRTKEPQGDPDSLNGSLINEVTIKDVLQLSDNKGLIDTFPIEVSFLNFF